jgi:hypothetical protein
MCSEKRKGISGGEGNVISTGHGRRLDQQKNETDF